MSRSFSPLLEPRPGILGMMGRNFIDGPSVGSYLLGAMAEHSAAVVAFVVAAGLGMTFPKGWAQTSTGGGIPDPPSETATSASTDTPPESPFQGLEESTSSTDPLSSDEEAPNEMEANSLDAVPALGSPTEDAPDGQTPPAQDQGEPTNPTDTPALSDGPGLQGFYPVGQAPDFIYNYSSLSLPYTTDPNISIGRARTRLGPFRMGINLSASTAYNDNVFGTSSNPEGDIVSTLTPSIYVEAGHRGSFRLLYTPTLQSYAHFTSQNTTNESLLISSSYRFSKLRLGMDFGYTTRNGLFPDSNGTANQSNYNLNLRASYRVSAKTTLSLSYAGSLQRSDPGGDTTSHSVTLSSSHPITHRASAGGTLTAGFQDSQDGNREPYVTIGVTGGWRATSTLDVSGNIGVQARQLAAGQGGRLLVSPVFNFAATWHHPGYPTFTGSFTRAIGANGFDTVTTDITTTAAGSASVSLWKKISVTAGGGLSYVEQQNSFGGQSTNYTYAYGSLSLSYVFRSFLNCSLFCNVQQRFSDVDASNYRTDIVGISLGTRF